MAFVDRNRLATDGTLLYVMKGRYQSCSLPFLQRSARPKKGKPSITTCQPLFPVMVRKPLYKLNSGMQLGNPVQKTALATSLLIRQMQTCQPANTLTLTQQKSDRVKPFGFLRGKMDLNTLTILLTTTINFPIIGNYAPVIQTGA